MVDSNCFNTLHAFNMGYNFPIKNTGERMSEPEKNVSKVLLEALETLTFAINKEDNSLDFKPNATNPQGTPYLSALSRRK